MSERYNYRNCPCSITDDDKLWCILGADGTMCGVLEWCYDEEDAKSLLEEMQQYPQFQNLKCIAWSEIKADPIPLSKFAASSNQENQ